MIRLSVMTAEVKRPLSPGQTRVVIRARDENDWPVALFLCGIEPPNTFERRMRESFHTVCSVEDMAEYPVGVASPEEVDPQTCEPGVLLYAVQENAVYVRSGDENDIPAWMPYRPEPEQKAPNVHAHKLPFFRRSEIDIILPNRDFVVRSIEWISRAVRRLEQDQHDLEQLKPYE
jgi:hypothetical protein